MEESLLSGKECTRVVSVRQAEIRTDEPNVSLLKRFLKNRKYGTLQRMGEALLN